MPYYVVKTSLNALAIVAPLTDLGIADNGADSYLWWTWAVRIRTVTEIQIRVPLVDNSLPPVYQEIAKKCLQLKELGLSNRKIALHLLVDEKTEAKAINWIDVD